MFPTPKTCNNYSVDEEPCTELESMNIWQTLEILSDVRFQKQYSYNGFNDTIGNTKLRTIWSLWPRDSFIGQNAVRLLNDQFNKLHINVGGEGEEVEEVEGLNGRDNSRCSRRRRTHHPSDTPNKCGLKHETSKSQPNNLLRETENIISFVPDMETDFLKCSFNFPRISSRLERLMGTNVVRLTDRKYMKELRQRIEEDYLIQLQKRITERELKEVERERILIIEGKWDQIPKELADDPILMVNKKASIEIQKQRAKLKTSRERNSERLKLQGAKWERERLQHDEEERIRAEAQLKRRLEQKELEERYKTEDGERCMDLLRIHNEDWRPCEQKLKEFLQDERARMKARSRKKPKQFSSDPKDLRNIIRARKEQEKRARGLLEDHSEKMKSDLKKPSEAKTANARLIKQSGADQQIQSLTSHSKDLLHSEEEERQRRRYLDENSDVSTESELIEVGSSISESKRKHAARLEEEMEEDVQKGLLISKGQYSQLRHEEDKIKQLRHAANIRDLYRLAEEIIIGERIPEPVVEEEAEEEVEEEEVQEDDSELDE